MFLKVSELVFNLLLYRWRVIWYVVVSKQKQTLFIKNLPTETTQEQVKALSADIIEVRMDVSQNKSEKNPKFVVFYIYFVIGEL